MLLCNRKANMRSRAIKKSKIITDSRYQLMGNKLNGIFQVDRARFVRVFNIIYIPNVHR